MPMRVVTTTGPLLLRNFSTSTFSAMNKADFDRFGTLIKADNPHWIDLYPDLSP